MKRQSLRFVLAAIVLACWPVRVAVAAGDENDAPARQGLGWSMAGLDLGVRVLPSQARMSVEGTIRLRLVAFPESFGPTLLMNTRLSEAGQPVMAFTAVSAPGAKVEIGREPRAGRLREAHVRFDHPMPLGSEITVDFSASSAGAAPQIVVDAAAALASWVTGWHPFTNPTADDSIGFTAGLLAVPGRTTLDLPAGWVGLVDGELEERRQSGERTVEIWSTPQGVARSFTAAPYEVTTERVAERVIRLYLLPGRGAAGRQRLAGLIAAGMAALEAKLGPFPFASYGVVEFPRDLPAQTWSAASQQTFITATSPAFDYEHGNLPLWAHEMSHGWWGNTVGTRGPGSKWVGESLANFGAYLAIEAVEGEEALREFVAFSRSGYSPYQSAAGYFALMRQGNDEPLATMGQGTASHLLADSKGSWIYHMLRRMLGDELFFGVLRGVILEFRHREIDVAEMRRRFVEAAPERELERFFAQWLDRPGAPVIDVDWYAAGNGRSLILQLAQRQDGASFQLELDVEIELDGGQRLVETVRLTEESSIFEIPTPARPLAVRLDPGYKLLIWRPEYGPPPGATATTTAHVPDEILRAVVGTYRFRGMGKLIEVFERDGTLYVQPADSPPLGLLYQGSGIFHVDAPGEPMVQEFDLTSRPSPSFVSREGKAEYVADRVEPER